MDGNLTQDLHVFDLITLCNIFVTRNVNVACELRLSTVVCHTFPSSTVLALRRCPSNNKTARARARSCLFIHSITTLNNIHEKVTQF